MKTFIALIPTIALLTLAAAMAFTLIKDEREKSKAIATLAPGPYVRKSMLNNPFIDKYNFVTVLEVRDGWVKYHYTLDTNRNMSHHSDKAENFVGTYTHYKG